MESDTGYTCSNFDDVNDEFQEFENECLFNKDLDTSTPDLDLDRKHNAYYPELSWGSQLSRLEEKRIPLWQTSLLKKTDLVVTKTKRSIVDEHGDDKYLLHLFIVVISKDINLQTILNTFNVEASSREKYQSIFEFLKGNLDKMQTPLHEMKQNTKVSYFKLYLHLMSKLSLYEQVYPGILDPNSVFYRRNIKEGTKGKHRDFNSQEYQTPPREYKRRRVNEQSS